MSLALVVKPGYVPGSRAVRKKAGDPNNFVLSPMDIPAFARLAAKARGRGVMHGDSRLRLYEGLGLSDKQMFMIERDVVGLMTRGYQTPSMVRRIAWLNVFYVCDDANNKPVYKRRFIRVYRKADSVAELEALLNIGTWGVKDAMKKLGLLAMREKKKLGRGAPIKTLLRVNPSRGRNVVPLRQEAEVELQASGF